ncbi:unnamed protein product [Dimorphilus gyrociliatus]|uniref:Uncharacterized protein n=1 Tax=Dimorphilus gyrociliatus TaxID=2664684 RepID=A0A7I8V6T0_9ANNE|nr:unnamed protein product [Dimorphilus gyrociliatus]
MSRSQSYSPLRRPPMSPCRLIDEILSDSEDDEEISSSNKQDAKDNNQETNENKKAVTFSTDNATARNDSCDIANCFIPKQILQASLNNNSRGRKQKRTCQVTRKKTNESEKRKAEKHKREKFDILTYLLPKL